MVIKCCRTDCELQFSEREGLGQSAGKKYFRVTIKSKQLSSFTDVYIFDPYVSHLVSFFEDLAKNWKGFEGEKTWSSLEGEFSLICTSDNTGHFELEATITKIYDTMCARKSIYIESGQLEDISLKAKDFFNFSKE